MSAAGAGQGGRSRRVLVCGPRAYAARGLRAALEAAGHSVDDAGRGQPTHEGGAPPPLPEQPHLADRYDVVINYVVLRGETVERNVDFIRSLIRLCDERAVGHLVHISSLSAVRDDVLAVSEASPIKTDPRRSGPNAAAKIAAELCLERELPAAVKLTIVRPAAVISGDMADPVGSIGVRAPDGGVVVMGRGERQRPLILRSVMNRAVVRLVERPPAQARERMLFVDRHSPSCLAYVQACCDVLRPGARARAWPYWRWAPLLVWREARQSPRALLSSRLWRTLRERNALRAFDPTATEERLGMSLSADWRFELAAGAPPAGGAP
jgi:nucleoside-diphosphate-sugar epimerase